MNRAMPNLALVHKTDLTPASDASTCSLIPQSYPAAFTQLAMTLGGLGAIPTMLWLLIKGANAPKAVLQEQGGR